MVTFIVCYVGFMVFPVSGPYYEFARPAGQFVANPMARLVYATLAQGSSYGAAFPSSHVAAAVAATLAGFAGSRRLGVLLTVPTLLLAIGVVYCQMHYAIDAVVGAAIGFTIPAILSFHRRPLPR
jgi:membrane-associated phospholipid phosphatase